MFNLQVLDLPAKKNKKREKKTMNNLKCDQECKHDKNEKVEKCCYLNTKTRKCIIKEYKIQ